MSDVALRDRAGGGGELELVDAFTERALAVAASAAAPNTRGAYATAYRTFTLFLRARYGQACVDTFTVAAVAAWRDDELTAQGLSPRTVALRVSGGEAAGRGARRRPVGRAGALHAGPAGAPECAVRSRALTAARSPGPVHDVRHPGPCDPRAPRARDSDDQSSRA